MSRTLLSLTFGICTLAQAIAALPPLSTGTLPAEGEVHFMVILAQFSDKSFTIEDPAGYFSRQTNSRHFSENGANGSVRDYFADQSYGRFTPVFDIYGPVTLPHPARYYGANNASFLDTRPHQAVIDACDIMKDSGKLDFAKYDADKDGSIDNVYLIYAGYPESSYGGEDAIWPHPGSIADILPGITIKYGGKRLDHYVCAPELMQRNTPDAIGTMVREISSLLGLPTLANTDDPFADYTPGAYSVLDAGSYNSDGTRPLGYGVFERCAMRWLSPDMLERSGSHTLKPVGEGGGAVITSSVPGLFYMIENRKADGWDADYPSPGLNIWRVDYDRDAWESDRVNADPSRQRVARVEAGSIPAGDGVSVSGIRSNADGSVTFNYTGFTDAIGEIRADSEQTRVYHDLTGRKVASPVPGIYIVSDGEHTFKQVVR